MNKQSINEFQNDNKDQRRHNAFHLSDSQGNILTLFRIRLLILIMSETLVRNTMLFVTEMKQAQSTSLEEKDSEIVH